MGASHSRARPGSGPAKMKKFQLGKTHSPPASGYFILSLKGDRIKVVNAESNELKLLTIIIRRHCKILREGWDRHLTFSYKLKSTGRHCMIQLVADFLLSLYQAGWEPMTPIDMGLKKTETGGGGGPQTAICFRRRYEPDEKEIYGSSYSLLSSMGTSRDGDNSCLCLETYRDNYIGFHDVSNTILYELVDTVRSRWSPGLKGVSMAVGSVISDYTTTMPAVLPGHPDVQDAKYIQLEGRPWAADTEDADANENLQISIIACLSREGYKLSMAINMEATSRVFFFIRDREETKAEVRIPNMAGAGLGEKDTLSVYRPMVVRSKSSFFRTYNGKTASVRRKVRASLRKKAISGRGGGGGSRQPTVMTYKPQLSEPAWWQQTSTDVSSDHEEV